MSPAEICQHNLEFMDGKKVFSLLVVVSTSLCIWCSCKNNTYRWASCTILPEQRRYIFSSLSFHLHSHSTFHRFLCVGNISTIVCHKCKANSSPWGRRMKFYVNSPCDHDGAARYIVVIREMHVMWGCIIKTTSERQQATNDFLHPNFVFS